MAKLIERSTGQMIGFLNAGIIPRDGEIIVIGNHKYLVNSVIWRTHKNTIYNNEIVLDSLDIIIDTTT
jgi:hypothetical protein